jgi:mono/diheme cytochrome c family protein
LSRDVSREAEGLTAAFAVLLLVLGGSSARGAEAGSIPRGAYLAAAAGCDQCHTDVQHNGSPYAGGRAIETSFGTIFTPNITPDPETGIGRWRSADIERALRWGIAPDDSGYLPAFPFPFYNRLTQNDLLDLMAFLRSLPAEFQVNYAATFSIFSTARTKAAVAILAEPFIGPWRPDATKDRAWNRGSYLVNVIGRCGDCHTPRNWLGAHDPERFLAGTRAGPGGKAVPNITPDRESGIGKWSEDDIVTLLKDGQMPDFDFVGGAMAEVVRNTSRLDDSDRQAIASYLRSLPPIRSERVR